MTSKGPAEAGHYERCYNERPTGSPEGLRYCDTTYEYTIKIYGDASMTTKCVAAGLAALAIAACSGGQSSEKAASTAAAAKSAAAESAGDRKYLLERVDDAAVVQLYADGFAELPLKDKTLIWHLYQAAIAGRDIYYDQSYAHAPRDARRPRGDPRVTPAGAIDPATLAEIQRYTKLFWINSGPYNNLTARKFVLTCTPEAFAAAAAGRREGGRDVPARRAARRSMQLLARLQPHVLRPRGRSDGHRRRRRRPGQDILTASANNLYVGVTMKDLEGFTEQYPLNSRLVKQDGKLVEEVYRVGGRYGAPIAAIVGHLEAAIPFATEPMAKALRALITFYRTGETTDREAYDIAWVAGQGVAGRHDQRLHRGLPRRARHQGRVGERSSSTSTSEKTAGDPEARRPTRSGSRTTCRGIRSTASRTCRASPPTRSTSSIETGDSGPITPIGINLPNDQAIREQLRQQVGVAVERHRGLRQVDAARRSAASSRGRRRRPSARAKWSALAGELTTEHARGDRARLGQDRRAA